MSEGEKTAPDWERIEVDYRAGVLSLREIAAANGITHGAINKRRKRDGWERCAEPSAKKKVLLPQADEKPTAGFVYAIFIDAPERFYKIGMAARFDARFDAHQCASPYDIGVACAYFVGDMRSEERALHERFKAQRVRGEWFRLTTEDVKSIASRGVLV